MKNVKKLLIAVYNPQKQFYFNALYHYDFQNQNTFEYKNSLTAPMSSSLLIINPTAIATSMYASYVLAIPTFRYYIVSLSLIL